MTLSLSILTCMILHHTPCRVLRLKRRFRDIGSTTIALLPRLANITVLLIVVYYFFAIIGIECLNGTVYRGCWLAVHVAIVYY